VAEETQDGKNTIVSVQERKEGKGKYSSREKKGKERRKRRWGTGNLHKSSRRAWGVTRKDKRPETKQKKPRRRKVHDNKGTKTCISLDEMQQAPKRDPKPRRDQSDHDSEQHCSREERRAKGGTQTAQLSRRRKGVGITPRGTVEKPGDVRGGRKRGNVPEVKSRREDTAKMKEKKKKEGKEGKN